MPTCPKCGGQFDLGRVSSGNELNYVSDRQTGMVRRGTLVRRARACLNCGYIELFLDPRELAQRFGG